MTTLSSTTPITEYCHNLLDASGKWASQWQEGDVHTCWYDGHPFDWFPVPVPTSYDEVRRTYRVFGTFCCFQCAKAWQISNPSFNTPISRAWLAVMAKEYFGYKKSVIHPSPEKWVLLSNQLNIDEFRAQCDSNIPTETVHPPLLPACMASISGNTSKVLASICTTRNNETLAGDEETEKPSTQKISVYEKYLSEQQQPHAEVEDVRRETNTNYSATSAAATSSSGPSVSNGPSDGPSADSVMSSLPASTKKKKSKVGGTLASFMRK